VNLFRRIFRHLRTLITSFRPRRWLQAIWQSPNLLGDRYTLNDNTTVTVYTDQPELFAAYPRRQQIQGVPRARRVQVSLIATTRNEGDNARRMLTSILGQTRLPDEIVIVDAGSRDGTVEVLREVAAQSGLSYQVLVEPGANISRGRNLAIAHAQNPVIAALDFGGRLSVDWLEKLIAPFEIDPATEVVAGWFEALGPLGQPVYRMGWASLAGLNPQSYLPSSRSVAFTKEAWRKVGGYPEWLTLTGEDTYFALELKRCTTCWAFMPDAMMQWDAPSTSWAYWKKLFTWSIGDGEAGLETRYYNKAMLKSLLALGGVGITLGLAISLAFFPSPVLAAAVAIWVAFGTGLLYRKACHANYSISDFVWETPVPLVKMLGFIKGWSHRRVVDRRRFQSVNGVFFMLSGVPVDDIGGGARSTQITLELLSRGWLVVFVNKFPKFETVDLGLQIRHPNLLTAPISRFSLKHFWRHYGRILADKPKMALVEFPLKDFIPLMQALRAADVRVVYDLLDNWNTSLGASWYTPQIEQRIFQTASALVATAPSLAQELEQRSGRPVSLLPNAVNTRLFNPHRLYSRPADLPASKWIATYVGSLWGTWFDWALLVRVAQAYPEAGVMVIGDYAGQCKAPPPNLHFLGLKPQYTLPAYLAHADVAIIPWQVNDITQSTSPLKVYEYLAMHKPVVAPDIQPLRGLPGVHLARDANQFVALVGHLRQVEPPVDEMDAFIQQNDWSARVEVLLSLVNTDDPKKG
jgi:glycosyltransferase involved in cell wall biosynthesis